MNKTAFVLATFLFFSLSISAVMASPEAVFQWERNGVEPGKATYINLYQNFKEPYNFTIISDLVKECWVIKDYSDENRIVCRSENGLCKSLEPINYQYIKCETKEISEKDEGKRAILFYEYDKEGRRHGIYQTDVLRVNLWWKTVKAAGPFMIALIAIIIVVAFVVAIIYFGGSSLAAWFRELGRPETETLEELKSIKSQIGKKGEVSSNCIVIY